MRYCNEINLRTYIIPSIDEVVDGKLMKGGIRQVRIEDLLGRPEIEISLDRIREVLDDKVIMVTGAAGSQASSPAARSGTLQLFPGDGGAVECPPFFLH